MNGKLAIFDCDGTLIDGQASICNAMDLAFEKAGLLPPPRSTVRRIVGLSLPQAMRQLAPKGSATQHTQLVENYKEAFRSARSSGALEQDLFDGMRTVLDTLRAAGWALGVATGMSQRGLTHCLAPHELSDYFCTLQTADHHPSKPHPAMLQQALFEASTDPRDAVMIGDTIFDMHMAQSAGVRGIGVSWGYHEVDELRAAGAEFIAHTPDELGAYLA